LQIPVTGEMRDEGKGEREKGEGRREEGDER
jgi:hypothetical protein